MRERRICADHRYLLVPVGRQKYNFVSTEGIQILQLFQGETLKEEYELTLDEAPWSWSPIFLERYPRGTELTLRLTGGNEALLDTLRLSDRYVDEPPIYREPLRPQCHFSPAHGFMNDPNGLLYHNGVYHYFSQLNPFGYTPCNTHWLHAVSRDLCHWQELPYAILPGPEGRIYSGCGVMDEKNVSGLGEKGQGPMLLFYTAAGSKSRWSRGKAFEIALAYSTDEGKTFRKYEGNPVVANIAFANRDPKVAWVPECGLWVMAIFLDSDRYQLLTSQNLLDWAPSQILAIPGSAECPDLFRIRLEGTEQWKWVFWGCTDNYLVGHMEEGLFVPEGDYIPGPSHKIYTPDWVNARSTGGYAAQTYFGAPEGRIIQHSWLRPRTEDTPFLFCASIANELRLVPTREGPRLRVLPAKEIGHMYEHVYEVRNRGFEEFERLPKDIFSECMDISFTVDIQGDRVLAFALRGVLIAYEPATGHLLLPTGAFDIGKGLTHLEFRFVTDRLSIEIYVNDGAFNTAVCQPLQPFETALKPVLAEPGFSFDLSVRRLSSIWASPERTERERES